MSTAERQASLLQVELRFLLDRARTETLQHDVSLPEHAPDKKFSSPAAADAALSVARTRIQGRKTLPLKRWPTEGEVQQAVQQRLSEASTVHEPPAIAPATERMVAAALAARQLVNSADALRPLVAEFLAATYTPALQRLHHRLLTRFTRFCTSSC